MISIDGSILIFKEHPNKGIGYNSQIDSEPVAAHWNRQIGGADRARTGDLLVANQVLSQLSYSPFARLVRRSPGAPRSTLRHERRFNLITRKHGGSGKI